MPNSRIEYLTERFYAKDISPSEHEELLLLLAEKENKTIANNFFLKAWDNFIPQDPAFLSAKGDGILNDILTDSDKVAAVKTMGNRSGNWAKLFAAALLLIVSSISVYLHFKRNETPYIVKTTPVKLKTDIAPGDNRAVLTLANQQQIILDNATNGTIARQGNITVKKTANGQLVYKITANDQSAKANFKPEYNTVSTPVGGQYTVELPDGSKVWLNSASSLKFPTNFTGSERRVALSGEAYFEVAKNKEMPFRVNSRNAEVEVLGTHFNISAYPDEDINKTTLLEGSVKVSSWSKNCIIKPGEQASLTGGSPLIKVSKVDTEEAVAWKNGYFMFTDENIHSIMRKLSRWYGVDVEYEDPKINETFGGNISKFKNISEVLNILAATGTIHFKIIPGSVSGKGGGRVIVMK